MNRFASFLLIFALVGLIIIGCGPKKTKEQLYAEANKFEKEENFQEAIKTFERFVKNYPTSESADSVLFKIGQIYANNLTDFDKAIETHKRLIENYPDSKLSAHSLFMIGFHYNNNVDDTVSARKYYEEFLDKYPNHELASSVKWELNNLGKDPNELDFLQGEPVENAEKYSGGSQTKKPN